MRFLLGKEKLSEHKNIQEQTDKWTMYKSEKYIIALSCTEKAEIMIKLE